MNKCKGLSRLWFLALLFGAFMAGCANNGAMPIIPNTVADTIAPTVTVTSPTNGALAVPLNRKVTVAFSEVMTPATITKSSFTLNETISGLPIDGDVVPIGSSATFTPSLPLTTGLNYTATIKGGLIGAVKDLAGNRMANDFTFSFTTGPVGDSTSPTIIVTGALNGVTGLPVNRVSTATFSESMDPVTLATPAVSYSVCETAVQGGVCVTPVAGIVSYIGNTATFTPGSPLKANTWHKSTITVDAKDLAGNALISGLVPNPWSWKTGAAVDITAPKVTVTSPANLATLVPINQTIHATFDKAMNLATMTTANFTLKKTGPPLGPAIVGTVSYDVQNNIATFSPQSNLDPDTDYTATVTNGATDLAGNALVVPSVGGLPVPNPWTFKTAATVVPPAALAINLRGAASFGIASRAGMTSTGITRVNGDIALYPTALCTDSTGNAGASQPCLVKTYASPTGLTVNGSIYFAGDPFDSGGTANSVSNDLNIAWIEGKGKANTQAVGYLGGELGGKTIFPGVYAEGSTLTLSVGTVATLDAQGDANAVFIFKVGSSLVDYGILSNRTRIDLINGAQARNVWFITEVSATIGAGTIWNGNILAGSTITVNSDSKVMGRLLSGADLSGGLLTLINGVAAPAITTITVPE